MDSQSRFWETVQKFEKVVDQRNGNFKKREAVSSIRFPPKNVCNFFIGHFSTGFAVRHAPAGSLDSTRDQSISIDKGFPGFKQNKR